MVPEIEVRLGRDLPAASIAPNVNEALRTNSSLIITAPPGAGKSTLLPLLMLNVVSKGQKIVMLEPRRIAARQIAQRMAEMLGEDVGHTVGYRIRFESCVSRDTRIEVVTEGILTRMIQSDNSLDGYSLVIFDEFHERNYNADLALALVRDCQQLLRDDLKIVIMSATIDTSVLSSKLSARVIESEGRMFDVDTRYVGECSPTNISQMVAHTIRESLRTDEGDILAFLPGESEIHQCESLLSNIDDSALVYPLYGMLSQSRQRQAILPDPNGRRRIVLATPIAETSLTIEGVRVVVDSGFCRQMVYDPQSAMSRLETRRISLDMADQRRGRAGRLSQGVCYRLWSPDTERRMDPHREPEIDHIDLSPLVLELAVWGEVDASRMLWLTPPPANALAQGRELLSMLGAVDSNGRATDHGRRLESFPCHPRIAEMLLSASDAKSKALATDIAAILDERDPMDRAEAGIDINLRIEALRRCRRDSRNERAYQRIEKVASSYRSIVKVEADNGVVDCYLAGSLIASAYPERIASAWVGNNAMFRLSNGSVAMAEHTDMLAHESWLAIASLNASSDRGRIFLASPLDPSDLKDRVVEVDNVSWDSREGRVVAQREMRIGRLVLSSKPLHNIERSDIDSAILNAVKREGLSMLDFNGDDFRRLQNRILSIALWHPDEDWPDVSTESLMANASSWLAPYIGKAMNVADLKRIDIAEALLRSLDYEKQLAVGRLAPTHVRVPSGSNIKLEYQPNGSPPVLAVRLQECFGLAETPTVDNGNQKVMMHLLSPGFKPVQITQDLRSFWDNAYFDVRKELRNRYPKHVWPDEPWTEAPTRRAKPRQ